MNCVDDCKYREMLDDANADLQELKAEYDRLREYVEHERGVKEFVRVMAENSKLRELMRDMFRDFASCDYELKRHGRTFRAVTRYLDRMHELGVEVDG